MTRFLVDFQLSRSPCLCLCICLRLCLCGKKRPSYMWRSSLWLSNRLLLLVTFNPHWILSKPGVFVFFVSFSQMMPTSENSIISFLGKLSKNGPENDVLSESNERSAKDEKEKKEDAKRTPHPYFHFWFPLWTILISKNPFWDTGTQPTAHRRGF